VVCLSSVANTRFLQLNGPRHYKKAENEDPVILSSYVDCVDVTVEAGTMPRSITATHSDGGNAVSAIHHCVFGLNRIVLCRLPRNTDRQEIKEELGYPRGTIGTVRPNSRHEGETKPTLATTDDG